MILGPLDGSLVGGGVSSGSTVGTEPFSVVADDGNPPVGNPVGNPVELSPWTWLLAAIAMATVNQNA